MGHASRRGVSAVEFFLVLLILALAVVPLFDVFTGSARSVFQSKFSYLAQHVARETVEELRHAPFADLESFGHDWRAVEGPLIGRYGPPAGTSAGPAAAGPSAASAVDVPTYPEAYRRIETRVAIEPLCDSANQVDTALKKVVVEVRWQERGPEGRRQPKGLERFETIVGSFAR